MELRIDLPRSRGQNALVLTRDEGAIGLGDPVELALTVFPKPAKSLTINVVPSRIVGDFQAKGWETSRESFAVISTKERVALALLIRDRITEEDLDEELSSIVRAYGSADTTVERAPTRYWFWERDGARMMVSAALDERRRLNVAIALGHPRLMTALRMSPSLAQEDVDRTFDLLSRLPKEPK